jgi:hypothetical protein
MVKLPIVTVSPTEYPPPVLIRPRYVSLPQISLSPSPDRPLLALTESMGAMFSASRPAELPAFEAVTLVRRLPANVSASVSATTILMTLAKLFTITVRPPKQDDNGGTTGTFRLFTIGRLSHDPCLR